MKINVYYRLINIYLSVHIFASHIKVYFKYEVLHSANDSFGHQFGQHMHGICYIYICKTLFLAI